jgi:hypothetical protein
MARNLVADGLPNHWNLFNLQENPYFQTTLGESGPRYPLSLFVGRGSELKRLLAGIGGAGSSRQAVGGAPGVGKTTLVQSAKATALAHGYWATRGIIPFYPDDTAERVMGRILEGVYEAILTTRPETADHPVMQRAQQYVRAFRLVGGGGGVSLAGFGASASQSTAAVTPGAGLLLDGPRVIRELLALTSEHAKGIVLHLNNLENLSDRDVANAADILRSLRDPVLLQDGLHILLVGTTEAVTSATTAHPQLRSVFSLLRLEAMPEPDVQALLGARYRHVVRDSRRPATPPVEPEAVAALYPLFRGDLRGLFKALEEGVTLLVGVVGNAPGASLSVDSLRPALRQRYAELLAQTLSPTRQRQLTTWAQELGPEATPTQEELRRLWKLSQPSVSQALQDLGRAGYAGPLPRSGADVTTYAMSGASRLIFG